MSRSSFNQDPATLAPLKFLMASRKENRHHLDRLSALPGEILRHILSYLDTQSAIRTSALSKYYWRAWTASLLSLDFKITCTQRDFLEDYFATILRRGLPECSHRDYFENYVTNILQQREPSDLQCFRLSEHCLMSSEFTLKCIDYAAQHNVQHLRIRVHAYPPLRLPHHLLTSTFLLTLRLSNATATSIRPPRSVSLPNLRGLHLKNFVFSHKKHDEQFFSGCPNLENLVLNKCQIRTTAQKQELKVNCPNLTSLEIRAWRSPWEGYFEQVINVFAPRLLFFKLEGELVQVDFWDTPPGSLKEAYIDLSYPTQCSRDRMGETFHGLVSLLLQLEKAAFLSLLSNTDKVLSIGSASRKITLGLFVNWEIVEVRQEEAIKTLKRLFWPYSF